MMNTTNFKTRFCPSPTGLLHIGNLRTALFNALLARHHNGVFLLRIEDTDKERSETRFIEQLQADLKWLGLDWQEGPGQDLGNGPYWQSERKPIYDNYYIELEEQGLAYPCFCTEDQLALTRRVQRAAGQPPRYPGTCRELSVAEVQQKLEQGLKPTLRFKIPANAVIEFEDLVHGLQRFQCDDIGDFIIRRADGSAPFMYGNAIDDAMMGVTLASRGEDHLTNTPRQLMILNALKLPLPTYAHISLILGLDGSPLSKRNGSKSLLALREEGYLPLAIINHLARLGHTYAENDFMDLASLSEKFSMQALSKAPAKFDPEQLNYWQKQAVQHESDINLWQWMGDAVHAIVPDDKQAAFVTAIRGNIVFPSDALLWANALFADSLTFDEEQQTVLNNAGKAFFTEALQSIATHGADHQALMQHLKTQLSVKGKALFQPLRLALTAQSHGPDMAALFALLGESGLRTRFLQALALI